MMALLTFFLFNIQLWAEKVTIWPQTFQKLVNLSNWWLEMFGSLSVICVAKALISFFSGFISQLLTVVYITAMINISSCLSNSINIWSFVYSFAKIEYICRGVIASWRSLNRVWMTSIITHWISRILAFLLVPNSDVLKDRRTDYVISILFFPFFYIKQIASMSKRLFI